MITALVYLLHQYFIFFLSKLAYLFNMSIYSAVQNKSISMSMDLMNSAENWLDQGISLYPNYTAGADFSHLFMRSDVAQIQSLLHTPWTSLS